MRKLYQEKKKKAIKVKLSSKVNDNKLEEKP